MGSFEDEDIFIAGYPKSGNTWMQLLIASLVYGLDPLSAPDSLIQELVPDIYFKKYYKRFHSPAFFKTHSLPRPEYKRVINIVRDGRDVLCSYKHFNSALGKDHSFGEMIEGGAGLSFGKWHQHVLAWERNPFGAEMLVVRYEDLKENCVGQLAEIATFIGVAREESVLTHIAESTRVSKMQQREQATGWDNKRWPKDKKFVRKGVAGGFRDELTQEQITVFNAESKEALEHLGYPT